MALGEPEALKHELNGPVRKKAKQGSPERTTLLDRLSLVRCKTVHFHMALGEPEALKHELSGRNKAVLNAQPYWIDA